MDLVILLILSFLAGLIDAISGGGGLIQLPALFAVFPNIPAPFLMGTNKFASAAGTSIAVWNYIKEVKLETRALTLAAAVAFAASFAGSFTLSKTDPAFLKPLIMVLLILVLLYTLRYRDLDKLPQLNIAVHYRLRVGIIIGAAIGFYDGFFGPGTGSFLIVLFITVFGLNFLSASASAKVVNLGTNLAALVWFLPSGNIIWKFAVPMAACNLIGGRIGARLAISKGNYFVRSVFIAMVSALILKMGYDLFGATP